MRRYDSIKKQAVALLGCSVFTLLCSGAQATVFQAEDYSAYHDASVGNQGGHYRYDNVDIQATSDVGGGYNVGWIEAHEWLVYPKLVIPSSGSYTIRLRVASPSGAKASVDLNAGTIQLGDFPIPPTGGWQKWTTVSRTVNLKRGTYNLGVYAQTAGWNFNWIEVEPHEEETDEVKTTVYQRCNYRGWAASLETGSYNLGSLKALGFRNDDASAIRVTPGYEVVLYEHDNFRGRSTVITGDKSCLVGNGFNDAVSSLIVRRASSEVPPSDNNPPGGISDCGTPWRSANLTYFTSYPDPGSAECTQNNGCTWAGQFYGMSEVKSESWVAANNIIAVHSKDWGWLGKKTLNLRQGTKSIKGSVIDLCSDSDCAGCCTRNLGGDGHLIDIEKHTMERFDTRSGIVEFQICE